MKRLLMLAALAALMAGCQTHLDVRPDGAGRAFGESPHRVGVDYGLPMLQYKLNVTRTLVACKDAYKNPTVRFLAKVTAEPHYVVGERYVVDYHALSNWSKTSSFVLETYDNGAIKSLNASAQDQTAGIIGDVVKTGIGLLALSSGVPLPVVNSAQLPPGAPPPKFYYCTPAAIQLLADLESSTADVKKKTETLTELIDEIGRLERAAGMNALTAASKSKLEELGKSLKAAMKKAEDAKEGMDKLSARMTAQEEIIWPTEPTQLSADAQPNPKGQEALLKLVALRESDANETQGLTETQLDGALALRVTLKPTVAIAPQQSCVPDPNVVGSCALPDDYQFGLHYRSPVPSQLIVCQVDNDNACSTSGATSVIVSANVLAPQLGPLRILPLVNKTFQDNELKATFRENGGIATFSYQDKAARGKVLSGSVASAVSEVLAYRDAREAYREKQEDKLKTEDAAKKKATLDELDAEIAKLEKQQKIEQLKATTSQSASLSDVQTETVRLNAQIALLEAQKKLHDAKEALNSKP